MTASTVSRPIQAVRARRSPLTDLAVLLTAAAALAHAIAVPDHLRSWPLAGVFFAVLAAAQGCLAVVLLRNRFGDRTLRWALWATVGVIGLYLWSRSIGLPFDPGVTAHGAPPGAGRAIIPDGEKRVAQLDTLTVMVEVLAVITFTALQSAAARRRTANLLLVFGVGLWALTVATWI